MQFNLMINSDVEIFTDFALPVLGLCGCFFVAPLEQSPSSQLYPLGQAEHALPTLYILSPKH